MLVSTYQARRQMRLIGSSLSGLLLAGAAQAQDATPQDAGSV